VGLYTTASQDNNVAEIIMKMPKNLLTSFAAMAHASEGMYFNTLLKLKVENYLSIVIITIIIIATVTCVVSINIICHELPQNFNYEI
jgi:hypothetical protein